MVLPYYGTTILLSSSFSPAAFYKADLHCPGPGFKLCGKNAHMTIEIRYKHMQAFELDFKSMSATCAIGWQRFYYVDLATIAPDTYRQDS